MSGFRPDRLNSVRVGDVMRAGIFTCEPDTPVREMAAMMASLRIHAVALRADPPQAPALISDLDLVAALADGGDLQARDVVAGTAITVSRAKTLRAAAKLMAEHGAAHLIVVNESSGHPVGVLSTSDILQASASTTEKE